MVGYRDDTNQLRLMQIQATTNFDFETLRLARSGFIQVPLSGIE
jgi:hypothetical protein